MDRRDIGIALDTILIPMADSFCWTEFGSAGGPCFDPNHYSTPAAEINMAVTLAGVQIEMRKFSDRHIALAKQVAKNTGNRYVTYPFLRDAVSRLLAGTTLDNLLFMVNLSRQYRQVRLP